MAKISALPYLPYISRISPYIFLYLPYISPPSRRRSSRTTCASPSLLTATCTATTSTFNPNPSPSPSPSPSPNPSPNPDPNQTLQRDADKLSARLEVKADTHRKLSKEVALTKQRLEKAAAAASSSSRQVDTVPLNRNPNQPFPIPPSTSLYLPVSPCIFLYLPAARRGA